jgi:hypothetical protein
MMHGHGTRSLDDIRQKAAHTPTSHVTVKEGDDEELTDGSEYASDRCGIENTKYAQQGLVLIETETETPIAIMYAAIQNSIRWLMPCTLEFVFEDDRGAWQVHIVGGDAPEAKEKMKLLQMRLIGGKRELLHCGSKAIIKAIRITKVEEEEET